MWEAAGMASSSSESPRAYGGGLTKLLEPLSPDDLDKVHAQAMRILSDVGTEVHDEGMRARLAAAGQRVQDTRVRWDPDFVMATARARPGDLHDARAQPRTAASASAAGALFTPRWEGRHSPMIATAAAATAPSPTTSNS